MIRATSGTAATAIRPIICLVDDDAGLLRALRFALEADGYAVAAYESGEALMADAAALAGAECLVIDEVLPGISGLALFERLRREGRTTAPAVVITTNPSTPLRRRAAAMGVPIVEKPLIGTALSEAVARGVSGHGAADRSHRN